MANAERSIRRAMSANSPAERTERLTRSYLDTQPEGRDAFAMVLIARVAMTGRGAA
ncbi:hypothetical protein K6L44_16190 [Gluconacetobacter entanii]|uniref:hypothetical protein n=1 Tax=Gluconacetobacter entanii TaxID=108528 RepID=UPI001C935C99|nr:hypothetical protein [Gluconacetobacter entanii]MBY4641492.1 hypothetical protein [Gluconacetobacter entanii]MCW4581996.1 hypothetical protein [Gluconacetobacter entanii]MCW4585262.1 hypothetical protein [Gluconacetobacter entanii]MCW4588839.1 hypothetical protein [Gluconacetobacter entanii]